ncbi:hypothetical protein V501_09870 [Pseudogymnoascus sp. VKM F-4519 (FW-2642)]|nr:hypothetical protein V501_09870 [Pseudogymnoascus sp. VKM F-4519 (FW-2642)]
MCTPTAPVLAKWSFAMHDFVDMSCLKQNLWKKGKGTNDGIHQIPRADKRRKGKPRLRKPQLQAAIKIAIYYSSSFVARDLYSGTRVRNLACQKPRPRLSRLKAGNLRNRRAPGTTFSGDITSLFPHFNPELINLENSRCFFVATEINLISSAAKSSSSNPHRFVNRGTLGRRKGQRIPLGGLSRRQRIARKGRSDTACSAFRLESSRKGRASRKPQQWAQRSLETSLISVGIRPFLFAMYLLSPTHDQNGFGGCELTGINLPDGKHLGNIGSIILCGLAILVSGYLLWRSERKQAAVGRREMQLFLLGYIIIEICEIFTVGVFPLNYKVRLAFSGIHLGMIVATTWILMLNAAVGYQIIDDGTPMSIGLVIGSAVALLVGTGYIALDTGFRWTGHFDSSLTGNNRNIGLYVLYQLAPIIFLTVFFILETILVLRVLGERKPMIYLGAAALFFILGQIFNYVVSTHICHGTSGKIDGAIFETLFTLLSVVTIWYFWSSITEDDWPMPAVNYP